jgi:hypothetical protein
VGEQTGGFKKLLINLKDRVNQMDRFLRGFIVGVAADALKDALNLFSYYVLHLSKLRYADFISVLLLGHKINNTPDFIMSQILELGYAGTIGVLFIFFAYQTSNKRLLWFKGIFFGETAFLFAYALGSFFKIPHIYKVSAGTAISQFITSGIYGVGLGLGTYWWESKLGGFKKNE